MPSSACACTCPCSANKVRRRTSCSSFSADASSLALHYCSRKARSRLGPARVVGLFVRPRHTNSMVATSPLDPCACEINAQREHAKGDAPAVAAPCLPRGLLESGSRLEAQGSGLPDRDVVGAKRNMLSVRPKRSSCRNNRRSGLCDSDDCCDTIRCVFRSQKSVPACMRYGRAGGSWTGRSWG